MNDFKGVDYYNIASLLSEEEKMVRNTVREFVSKEVVPIIEKYYSEGSFPLHLVPKMAELGFLGSNLPEEFGCAGLNNVAYGLIMQELERGDERDKEFCIGTGCTCNVSNI